MRMKANKKNRIKHQILQILLENEWFSASSIARLFKPLGKERPRQDRRTERCAPAEESR